jgi:hypothetical protein
MHAIVPVPMPVLSLQVTITLLPPCIQSICQQAPLLPWLPGNTLPAPAFSLGYFVFCNFYDADGGDVAKVTENSMKLLSNNFNKLINKLWNSTTCSLEIANAKFCY